MISCRVSIAKVGGGVESSVSLEQRRCNDETLMGRWTLVFRLPASLDPATTDRRIIDRWGDVVAPIEGRNRRGNLRAAIASAVAIKLSCSGLRKKGRSERRSEIVRACFAQRSTLAAFAPRSAIPARAEIIPPARYHRIRQSRIRERVIGEIMG